MYIYFDKNGTLKEIITERTFRVGDSKRDKIYAYWDGEHSPLSGWIKYRLADGTETEETEFWQRGQALVGKELPTNPPRNLKYFSYDHTYEQNGETKTGYLFYEIKISDEVLSSSLDNDEKIPTMNNLVVARMRFVLNEGAVSLQEIDADDTIFSFGAIAFSVEENIGILTDGEITSSQYNYLICLLGEKVGIKTQSVIVSSLPTTGVYGTLYYVNNGQVYDTYIWNGASYVFLGTTSYGLYTEEQGENLEQYLKHKVMLLEEEIQSAVSGSPKGVYATVSALESANPDHNYIYVVSADGHWYYWNGSAWADGGQYQAVMEFATSGEVYDLF